MTLDIVDKVLQGSKRDCARLISIVENESKGYEEYLKKIYKHTGGAYVVGITGPPGAGKSTFTDKLVKLIRKENKKVGVIAIDPTSPFTKGAILGDRIRMNDLSMDEGVFIRSMGTRGSLGGLSNATQSAIKVLDAYGCEYIFIETMNDLSMDEGVFIRSMGTRGSLGGLSNATQSAIKVLDAYGCEYIFIETVGVGQSEIDIVKTADTTVMIMVPGLGDDIQAIKAGVMEIADVFVINKADKDGAKKTALEIQMMLDFRKDWDFRPPVDMAISETGEGVENVYQSILKHREYLVRNNILENKRLERNKIEIKELVQKEIIKLVNDLQYNKDIDSLLLKTMTKEIREK